MPDADGRDCYVWSEPPACRRKEDTQAAGRLSCRRTASSADAGRQPEPDYGRSAASPGRCPGRQHCHCRQHCRREQEKAAGNDFRSRPERIGSAGRQPQKRNRSENMGSQPYKSHLAGARNSRRRTNLQPEILEIAHILRRLCRMCLCLDVEQQNVQGLLHRI